MGCSSGCGSVELMGVSSSIGGVLLSSPPDIDVVSLTSAGSAGVSVVFSLVSVVVCSCFLLSLNKD